MNINALRGASSYAPENTLAAFQKALEQEVDSIKFDVRLTKDNIPIIDHDTSINCTNDGRGYTHELQVSQLKKHDFGSSFSKKFKGETIPTLEETLPLIEDAPLTLHKTD